MERMTNDLRGRMIIDREKIAETLHAADPWLYGQDADGEDIHKPWAAAPETVKDYYRKNVDTVLAAVGLDDLDAAALRGARQIDPDAWTGVGYGFEAAAQSRESSLSMAQAVLEAALTATAESCSLGADATEPNTETDG